MGNYWADDYQGNYDFKSLAKLVVIDEDGEYYLYAPVTNEEVELYKDFGIGNSEFLLMEEFGLINIGARVVNTISVKSDPAGFQNDSLVLRLQLNLNLLIYTLIVIHLQPLV